VVLVVGGYGKWLLAPRREQAAQLEQQVATQQAQLAQTQSLVATYAGARKSYKTNYATVVRLGKAVTTDDDTRSLVVQLDAAAKRRGVGFDTINLDGAAASGSSASGATAATPTTPGAVNAGAFSAMPFTFAFTGTFSSLGNFFSRLENFVALDGDKIRVNGRLLRIETISLQPGADGWPGLSAQVGASSYIVPQATATATQSTTSTAPGTTAATATSSTAAQPG
jgi:hypothetical protein